MKRIILIIAIAFLYNAINAQDDKPINLQIIGGFGGVSMNILSLESSPFVLIG